MSSIGTPISVPTIGYPYATLVGSTQLAGVPDGILTDVRVTDKLLAKRPLAHRRASDRILAELLVDSIVAEVPPANNRGRWMSKSSSLHYDTLCVFLSGFLSLVSKIAPPTLYPRHSHYNTDAQATIRRLTHNEPSPSQQYALQARKHLATNRRREPGIAIEVSWCPAHKDVPGNAKADELAKLAAGQPTARGVEVTRHKYQSQRRMKKMQRSEAFKWALGAAKRQLS
ncbi:hypothetical protein BZA05DRAFT_464460 [Tricharina praecox]|uniref:uncharacterized protein n=1 Tax=Tricharina praecox TaxID=43433 RepID=UPI0022200A96|nr:uncharacterized protein BZA05DRAFT_464460 [Tricharina praecox]KAI5841615.1 hypothetical protein BZA05DRAFT_464460 [Tricharina praecox]